MQKSLFRWFTVALFFLATPYSFASQDMTSYITNPYFDGNVSGWTVNMPGAQNKGYQSAYYNNGDVYIYQFIEAWIPSGNYLGAGELSQTLSGLPEGQYVLEADIIAKDQSGKYNPVSGVYLFGESEVTYTTSVSTGDSSPLHFSLTFYNKGSQLTLGLRTASDCTANWVAMDNVTLTYDGEVTCNTTAISVSPETLTLLAGETGQLTASITTDNDLFNHASWTSSDETVCTVNGEGMVTALRSGTATVTATAIATSLSASATVTVEKNRPADLVINEIQVANIDQYIDHSYNYGGWIELYNPTSSEVTLTGLYLSELADSLTMFQLPSGIGTVPAGGFRVIYFDHNSEDGEYGSDAYKQVTFKLDYEGGTVYLSDSEGELITSAAYPQAVPRCSYARTTDGGATWGTTGTPTLEASNATSTFATERLAAPEVDTDGTLFTDAFSFNVAIPSGTTLRYTTDGTTPTLANGATSTTGRFSVSATTVYRFALFQEGYLPSPVVTRSFIYKNHDYYLPVLSIVTNPDNLYDDTIGVYVSGTNGISGNGQSSPKNWNMDWERPVNVEYLVPETNTEGETSFLSYVNQETNFEICGGWTRAYGGGTVDDRVWEMKSSFRLKAGKYYEGLNTIDYPFFPNKPYNKYKTLQIRNGGNDTYARIIDPAIQQIMLRSGYYIDCQDWQPSHVFFNGEYLGMMNIRENNNKNFGDSEYGIDTDEIDQFEINPSVGYLQKAGDDVVMQQWVSLAAQLANDPTNDNLYAQICELVDIDEYCNYMAAEIYLGCNDWLTNSNNAKGIRSRTDNGKFHIVFFDIDQAFNISDMLSSLESYAASHSDENRTLFINLFLNMLQYEPFQKQFIDAYCIVIGSVFEPTRSTSIINEMANTMDAALEIEGNDPWSSANSLINSITSSSTRTSRYGKVQSRFALGTGYDLTLSSNVSDAHLLVNGQEFPTRKFDGTLFAPITLTAKAPAGYTFKGWSQEGYSAAAVTTSLISESSSWYYYDQGSLDGQDWTSTTYDAASNGWQTGQAPFGYASDESKFMYYNSNTILDYGTDSSNKRPTYYFRKTFTLDKAPTEDMTFTLNYQVDDGFRFYVNGKDVNGWRCAEGCTYDYVTGDWAGNTPDSGTFTIAAADLTLGENVLAVEVHNNSLTSSDIYWDCSLVQSEAGEAGYVSTDETFCLSDLESAGTYTLVAEYEAIASDRQRYEAGGTPIRINEVSAGNDIYLNDYYEKQDWVELYNTTENDIDLSGMYLSDKSKNPQKYQISAAEGVSTIIPAHGTRIVWCDAAQALSQLHAPFKLDNADGSVVSIQSQDGTWADKVSYLAQERWQTYGRYPDGGNHETILLQPTIDKSNRLGTYDFTATSAAAFEGDDMAITLELASGWNWISHNMADDVSSTRFTGYAQCLKSQTNELYYDATLNWQGNLKMLEVAQGYKLQATQASEVTLRGNLFNPSTAVSVQKGWNWIGFPLYNATALETALANYTPSEGDQIASLTGFATYENGEWSGTLSSLTPGQGYLLYAGAAQDFCWHSLSSAQVSRRRYAAPRFEAESPWALDIHAYPNVMNLIARVEIDGEEVMEGSFTLGAFSNGECRGVAQWNDGLLYLTLHGQGGEPLTFTLLDREGQTFQADQQLTLRQQTLLGSRQQPYLLTIGSPADDVRVALDHQVLSVQYFSLDGRRLASPPKGISLQKTVYQDGRTTTHKVMH